MIKLICNGKNILAKWRTHRAEAQAKKFKKWQAENDATTSTKCPGIEEPKPKVEPKLKIAFKYESEDG